MGRTGPEPDQRTEQSHSEPRRSRGEKPSRIELNGTKLIPVRKK